MAMLPLLIRLVQSIKRWVDSKLMTHLINVSFLTIIPRLSLTSPFHRVVSTPQVRTVRGRETALYTQRSSFPGMVYYACYYAWRHNGSSLEPGLCERTLRLSRAGGKQEGGAFAVWLLFGVTYSIYACSWVRIAKDIA
jgi:hypothetical protein